MTNGEKKKSTQKASAEGGEPLDALQEATNAYFGQLHEIYHDAHERCVKLHQAHADKVEKLGAREQLRDAFEGVHKAEEKLHLLSAHAAHAPQDAEVRTKVFDAQSALIEAQQELHKERMALDKAVAAAQDEFLEAAKASAEEARAAYEQAYRDHLLAQKKVWSALDVGNLGPDEAARIAGLLGSVAAHAHNTTLAQVVT